MRKSSIVIISILATLLFISMSLIFLNVSYESSGMRNGAIIEKSEEIARDINEGNFSKNIPIARLFPESNNMPYGSSGNRPMMQRSTPWSPSTFSQKKSYLKKFNTKTMIKPVKYTEIQSASDKIVSDFKKVNIVFNIPIIMDVSNTYDIYMLLDYNKTIAVLKERLSDISSIEDINFTNINVSNIVKSELIGSKFDIVSLLPLEQAISKYNINKWGWSVSPKSDGNLPLYLVVSSVIFKEHSPYPVVVRSYNKIVFVSVPRSEKVKRFMTENWQWFLSTLIIPLFFFLFRNNSFNKNNKSECSVDNEG